MNCDCRPEDGSRVWRTSDGLHIDVRGLDPPEPAMEILRLIDSGEVDTALIAHLNREPIFLYPELDDRGWSYEIIPPSCGDAACEDDVRLRLSRWSR